MNILITGATGFIGRQLVASCNRHNLTVLSRNTEKAAILLGEKHAFIASLERLENLDNFDAVINLAGEPIVGKRWGDAQKARLCQSRWQITERLSTLISQSSTPPAVFISGSAVGYYGAKGDERLTETSNPTPGFTEALCAKWEQLALKAQSDNTRVCVLRTGIVLGNDGGALAKMLPAFRLGLGGPIGSGKQGLSWIHMADMLGLIHFLLEHQELQGIFNATAPNPVSSAEFSHTLGEVLHRPAFLPAPALAIKLLLGEAATLLVDGQYVLPKNAQDAGYVFRFPELRPALQSLL